jgi:hypothetical protein
VPTISLLVGSGIVVGSGLFLLYNEAQRAAAAAAARPAVKTVQAASAPDTQNFVPTQPAIRKLGSG